MQKKQGLDVTPAEAGKSEPQPMEIALTEAAMDVDEPPQADVAVEEQSMLDAPKKKKKKKASYKALMAGVLQSSSPSRDVEKEKEGLRKVTGGGAFIKVEKI
jgi:hypothetical protein